MSWHGGDSTLLSIHSIFVGKHTSCLLLPVTNPSCYPGDEDQHDKAAVVLFFPQVSSILGLANGSAAQVLGSSQILGLIMLQTWSAGLLSGQLAMQLLLHNKLSPNTHIASKATLIAMKNWKKKTKQKKLLLLHMERKINFKFPGVGCERVQNHS
ncbi:hypothetical protein AMECASPLE_037344 [Ameca splendens]|uniref:Uncharacterized protein n=1 Tax=Ameca splendens TaxID=208324 RepID=A0ABV0ZSN9_9TELE